MNSTETTAMPIMDCETDFWIPSLNTAVYSPIGFLLGILCTLVAVKCYYHRTRRRKLITQRSQREESFHHDNAVYWDHDAASQIDRMVELREQRRTDALFTYNSRHEGIQTEIDYVYMDLLLTNYHGHNIETESDAISLPSLPPPPPPPLESDSIPTKSAPKPPKRRSKDDCITKQPSYRKSNVPSCLQSSWIFSGGDNLATSDTFREFLNEEFSDQNSPLHKGEGFYTSVPSVVLIPSSDDGPPPCSEFRHSYINIRNLKGNNGVSVGSSLNHSTQCIVDYENTKIWTTGKDAKENDLSDEDTHVDCMDNDFRECARETLRRKQSQRLPSNENDDQYAAFNSLTAPQKPERPRTGYVVMELTEEVMAFLKVKENKLGRHIAISKENVSELYFDDRMKNGYMSMEDRDLL